jgi:outer membrane protein OmpA-like peptidoglycan-associated protein
MKSISNTAVLLFVFWFSFFAALLFFGCATSKKVVEKNLPKPSSEDVQVSKAEELMASTMPINIMPVAEVFFNFDKSNLGPEDIAIIDKILTLPEYSKIRLDGYCDERGTEEYNIGLGQRRADSVKAYIRSMVKNKLIETKSFGESQASSDPLRYGYDRRVDIYLK